MKILLGITVLLCAQDPKTVVSQKEIDTAIMKGLEYLKTAPSYGGWLKTNCDESREHKRPKNAILIKQTRTVGDKGDNSNSQYASLGLRACFDANVRAPEEVLQKARTWWVDCQGPDEGGAKIDKKAVTTGNGE